MTTINYSSKFNLYAPRIEQYEDIENSLFSDVYKQAKKSIQNVLEISHQACNDKNQIKDCNGIVAFTGDRGSGKTSAMLTIAGILNKNASDWLAHSSSYFEVLPTIEPSHLSRDETILDVVVSRLYTQFKAIVKNREKSCKTIPFDKQRDLLKTFAEAHDAIRAHNQSHEKRLEIESSIENLTRLASGNDMRAFLYRLIDEFLRFKTDSDEDTKPSKFLVLCIDDLDLNLNMGYEICEEIRKFFNLPNVIVLFSAKLSQLSDLIKQKYLLDLDVLIRGGGSSDQIEDMVTRYIEKLIPVTRRCAMPLFNVQTMSSTMLNRNDIVDSEPVNYVDEILRLLFKNTGVILLKNRFGSHYFIPTNLRAMLHLLSLLDSMAAVDILTNEEDPEVNTLDGSKKTVLTSNLSQLETYISEHSIRENLSMKYQKILLEMLEINWEELNQSVARMLFDQGLVINEANDSDGIMDICNADTLPENVSIGDALYMLDKAARQKVTTEVKVFCSVAKMIYSMRLVRLTFLADDDYSSLRHMLGGLIYNPHGDVILRGKRDFQPDLQFDEIKINPFDLDTDIATLDDLDYEFIDENGDKHIDSAIASEYVPYYFWLELHTVSVGRSYAKAVTPRWQRSDWFAPYYFQNDWLFAHSYKYLTISYLAFMTNTITYNAFDDSVYNWAVAFNEWRKKYITAIPIFSADIITHVTKHMAADTAKQLKSKSSGSDYYDAMTKAVKKIIENALSLLPPDNTLSIWTKRAVACPLWINKVWNFHKGIDGIWFSEYERETERIKEPIKINNQNEQTVQINKLRNRCTQKLAGIAAAQDIESLRKAVAKNISLSGLSQLPSEIRVIASQVQEYIKSLRTSLKGLDKTDTFGMKNSLIVEIQRLITAIDNYHG